MSAHDETTLLKVATIAAAITLRRAIRDTTWKTLTEKLTLRGWCFAGKEREINPQCKVPFSVITKPGAWIYSELEHPETTRHPGVKKLIERGHKVARVLVKVGGDPKGTQYWFRVVKQGSALVLQRFDQAASAWVGAISSIKGSKSA